MKTTEWVVCIMNERCDENKRIKISKFDVKLNTQLCVMVKKTFPLETSQTKAVDCILHDDRFYKKEKIGAFLLFIEKSV